VGVSAQSSEGEPHRESSSFTIGRHPTGSQEYTSCIQPSRERRRLSRVHREQKRRIHGARPASEGCSEWRSYIALYESPWEILLIAGRSHAGHSQHSTTFPTPPYCAIHSFKDKPRTRKRESKSEGNQQEKGLGKKRATQRPKPRLARGRPRQVGIAMAFLCPYHAYQFKYLLSIGTGATGIARGRTPDNLVR